MLRKRAKRILILLSVLCLALEAPAAMLVPVYAGEPTVSENALKEQDASKNQEVMAVQDAQKEEQKDIEAADEGEGQKEAEAAGEGEGRKDTQELENAVSLPMEESLESLSDLIADAIGEAREDLMLSRDASEEIAPEGVTAGSLVVVLDPGHDDTHAGAARNGLHEESINLKIANYCKQYLEATYTDVVVHMTRSSGACPHPGTSSTVDNSMRVADAKSVGADVYVSFHIDSTVASSTSVNGSTVYYPNANYNSDIGAKGASLASMVSQQITKLGIKSNGIRIRNSENGTYYPDGSLADYLGVIRQSKENGITAVLIEHAYINNASDAAFLSNEENLKNLGIADALGIAKAYSLSTEEVEYDAQDLTVTDINGSAGTFKITLKGATPVARIKDIQFKVYPVDDSSKSYLYTAVADKKTKGTYSATGNVANHGAKSGKYKVIAYALNAAERKAQLRSTTFTMEEAKPDVASVKLTAKLDKKQANATIRLANYVGAASVSFRVYSNENGKDDVKTYKATKQANGDWLAKVAIKDHKTAGDYTVVTYAKSYFGTTQKAATGSFTVDGPALDGLKVKAFNKTKGTFRLKTNNLDSAPGISEVSITVRNLSGKKKKVVYPAKKDSSGDYIVQVDMKDHDYQLGQYQFIVTATDKNQVTAKVFDEKYDFGQPQKLVTAKLKAKQTKLEMTASDLGIGSAIEEVKFKVYNATTGSKKKSYPAKKDANGAWKATAMVADFAAAGEYKVTAYVKYKGQSYKKAGKTASVTVSDVTGGVLKAKTKKNKCTLTISDIKAVASIVEVDVKAWPQEKKSAKYTYYAKPAEDGSYQVVLDTGRHGGVVGLYRYVVTVTLRNGVQKELLKGRFDSVTASVANEQDYYAISGASSVTVSQMMAYYNSYAIYPSFYAATDAPTLKKFCTIYYNECEAEGIKAEVAFAQAMKETNFLRYTGDVDISQLNFAGIGATGGGAKGNSFASVTEGIRAQVQHLKAYANTDPLKKKCVDPRFTYVPRGTAPYVEWLGIPDNPYGKGWATAQNYGSSILTMIRRMKAL